jgi:hypothetical protein
MWDEREGHDRPLIGALHALAEDDARLGASSEVEERLRHEVRSIGRSRMRRRGMGLAAAAVLVLAATMTSSWRLALGPSNATGTSGQSAGEELATEFFPLAYAAVPMTSGHLVRLEMSPRTLASLGVVTDAPAGSAGEPVLADVLVGEDGLARAVRFVRPVAGAIEQEQQP